MTGLGLSGSSVPSGEIRVGFRSGWVRSLAVTVGGVSLIGLAFSFLGLAQHQPTLVLELLSRWGFVWLLVLAAMFLLWDLAKLALAHLGNLAASVQQTAVAMNRIADKDDRERDRMGTEIAFVGQRMERMSRDVQESRTEQREHNRKMSQMLEKLANRAEGKG